MFPMGRSRKTPYSAPAGRGTLWPLPGWGKEPPPGSGPGTGPRPSGSQKPAGHRPPPSEGPAARTGGAAATKKEKPDGASRFLLPQFQLPGKPGLDRRIMAGAQEQTAALGLIPQEQLQDPPAVFLHPDWRWVHPPGAAGAAGQWPGRKPPAAVRPH